eukprot:g2482.t1
MLGATAMTGSANCHPCSLGFANPSTGQTQCQRCPAGEITYNFGETHCAEEKDQLLYDPIKSCSNYPNNTLTVGVLLTERIQDLTLAHE